MGKIKLGDVVEDIVTGYRGVAVAVCEYLTGCIQFEVQPRVVSESNEIPKTEWIDEMRLRIVDRNPFLKNGTNAGGFRNHPPPTRNVKKE